ncbi:MAG: hypothetical protein AAGK14_05865 [Verrucomicrobiota bacterium]
MRLTREERLALEKLIVKRGRNETISDVIREALSWCLHPGLNKEPCYVSPELHKRVQSLSKDLNRDVNQVFEDCVQGIMDMIENTDQEMPLIVMEIKLRRQYEERKTRK